MTDSNIISAGLYIKDQFINKSLVLNPQIIILKFRILFKVPLNYLYPTNKYFRLQFIKKVVYTLKNLLNVNLINIFK